MRQCIRFDLILLTILTALVLLAAPAAAGLVTVGTGGDYPTLMDAITSASVVDGDTIYVYNGTYSFTGLTKSLTLTGESRDLVTLDLGAGTATIAGSGTIIERFRFTNGLLSFPVTPSPAENMIVRDCIFEGMKNPGAQSGSLKVLGTNITVSGSEFRDNAVYNLVYLSGTSNVLENNIFRSTTSTASIRGVVRLPTICTGNMVRNNSFYDNTMPCILVLSPLRGARVYLNDFRVPDGTSPVAIQGTNAPPAFPWNTPTAVSYTYQGRAYTKVLGNYWNTYTGTDADGDGIGDTGHSLITNQVDSEPLMAPVADYFGPAVPAAPTADFSANATNGTAPLAVGFTDRSSGENITARAWDFQNDGTVDSTDESPTFTYAAAGNYTVNLTVTNAGGSDSEVKTDYITVAEPATPTPTVTPTPITVQPMSQTRMLPIAVANDAGVKYPGWDQAWGTNPANTNSGPFTCPADAYMITAGGGGLNQLHVVSSPGSTGQVTRSLDQNGTFYLKTTGGRGSNDNVVLLLTVQDPIPSDFSIRLKASGYTWTPPTPGLYNPVLPAELTYVPVALDETFTKDDFYYGPQTWRPGPGGSAPYTPPSTLGLYPGQSIADPSTAAHLMFVDLNVGNINRADLTDQGTIKVEYEFTNLDTTAAFTPYGWASASNQGEGISWTTDASNPTLGRVWVVDAPLVAGFAANATSGGAPLDVQFTDASTGSPASWAWDFQDDGVVDSTEQSPVFTYAAPGTYSVNLTVTNAAGSDSEVRTGYITVTEPAQVPTAGFAANVTSGDAPLAVAFTDASTGSPASWAWDFQDDGVIDSTEQNPAFTYAAPGTYTVNLTVTNAAGSDSEVRTGYITVAVPTVAPESGVLSAPRHIFVAPANGAKFDLDGAVYGGPSGTYYIKADGGGLNELHVTNDVVAPYGQVTTTNATSGTFWVTNTGGRGFDDTIVLLVSVQGELPDDFGVHVKSSGYTWTPGPVVNQVPSPVTYVDGAVNETFTREDFVYGPQTWKPGPGSLTVPSLPLWTGQDINDPSTASRLLFVDLKVGNLYPIKSAEWTSATDAGGARVEFSFTNMTSTAAFNAYGWCLAANQGQGISWTNRVEGTGNSGYRVVYEPPAGPTVVQVPGGTGLPTDMNGDGLYEDVNGNGRLDFNDVVLYFNQMEWIAANEPLALFDYNGNGRIDFADVVWLFNLL